MSREWRGLTVQQGVQFSTDPWLWVRKLDKGIMVRSFKVKKRKRQHVNPSKERNVSSAVGWMVTCRLVGLGEYWGLSGSHCACEEPAGDGVSGCPCEESAVPETG